MINFFTILIFFIGAFVVSSAEARANGNLSDKDKIVIQELADTYFSETTSISVDSIKSFSRSCEPAANPMACSEYICGKKFNCTYDGLINATKSCRGNFGDTCIKYICETKFNCTYDGIIVAAKACRGNVDAACVKYICETKFNCTYDGTIQAAKSCGGGE
jgi:hypothetical protein